MTIVNQNQKQNQTKKRTITKYSEKLRRFSNPEQAQKRAYTYLGKTARLFPSTNSNKKYDIYDKKNNRWVHFGQIGYEDYTKHKDKTRRKNYLNRSAKIRGDWKQNPYSANNLSRKILW